MEKYPGRSSRPFSWQHQRTNSAHVFRSSELWSMTLFADFFRSSSASKKSALTFTMTSPPTVAYMKKVNTLSGDCTRYESLATTRLRRQRGVSKPKTAFSGAAIFRKNRALRILRTSHYSMN
jgi:hypothetical protein